MSGVMGPYLYNWFSGAPPWCSTNWICWIQGKRVRHATHANKSQRLHIPRLRSSKGMKFLALPGLIFGEFFGAQYFTANWSWFQYYIDIFPQHLPHQIQNHHRFWSTSKSWASTWRWTWWTGFVFLPVWNVPAKKHGNIPNQLERTKVRI